MCTSFIYIHMYISYIHVYVVTLPGAVESIFDSEVREFWDDKSPSPPAFVKGQSFFMLRFSTWGVPWKRI